MKKRLKILTAVVVVSLLYCFILGIIFSRVSVPAFNAEDGGVDLPVVMYHSVLRDKGKSGKYVVTPDDVRSDIKYLKERGYTFVSAAELIDYCENGAYLPEKPAMLTFDDGFYNNYEYILPILRETGAKAVISVVGSYSDDLYEKNSAYGYVGWNEVFDLFISPQTEVGNHSYAFHSTDKRNGSQKKKNESMEEYKSIFLSDTQKAQNRFLEKTGNAPVIYTYPFGAYTEETTDWLREMGFKVTFCCTEGINKITRNPNSLFLLKRFNRAGNTSSAQFFEKILKQ